MNTASISQRRKLLVALEASALSVLFATSLAAQTTSTTPATTTIAATSITMPTYVAGGVAFNQDAAIGNPRFNGWISAIVPVASSAGLYGSTTADLVPVSKIDPLTKRVVYTFSASLRGGLHKTLYTGKKVQLLIGGDAGGSFTTLPTGTGTSTAVNLSGSFTGTFVYRFSANWAVVVPVRGLYTSSISGWILVPEIGLCWAH